ncbi:MAG: hypothetical protein LBU57_08125 [Dysgonamonadaceae bacterium]|jgi:hypothetical protein|nr:hypothetical protein [Dysgonamonadaceae bacterium]
MKIRQLMVLYFLILIGNSLLFGSLASNNDIRKLPEKGIPIHFNADEPGYVTLVIEDQSGNRLKNLVFDHPVQSGDNIIYWDGSIIDGVANPGDYTVRGVFHRGISPRLEYSIYSPGTPPWPTADEKGAWLADHTAPASVLFVPGGSPWPLNDHRPVMMLGSQSGEAGHALVWTDLNGNKLNGIKIRGWNGGIAMARDIGKQKNSNHVAYTVFLKNPSRDFGKEDPGALDLYVVTSTGLEMLSRVVGGVHVHDAFRELVGLAAKDGLLLLSNPAANELVAFDVRGTNKEPFAKIKVDRLGGITFEPDGKLLLATNGEIKRFNVYNDWKSIRLDQGQPVVKASDLRDPKQIIEYDRKIYVTDWGTSHQVKVFDAVSGRLIRMIGKAGGPQIGDYDELRMAHPLGMSIDSNGILWVAETDYLPKRVSRWNAKTGHFINAWYGPTQYGGGGFVDPKDKSRAYYPSIGNPGSMGLLEFKVDLATGRSKLAAVRYRDADPVDNIISYGGYPPKHIFFPTDMIPLGSHGGTTPAQTFYYNGQQYFTNSYNTYWYNQGGTATLWVLEEGICRPVASAGWVLDSVHCWIRLNEPDVRPRIPAGNGVFFIWTDKNNDHAPQADEIRFTRPPHPCRGGVIFQPDLSIVSGGPFHIPTNSIDKAGVPDYDFNRLKLLSRTPASGDVAMSPDGWLIVDCRGFKDGQQRWSFEISKTKTPPVGRGDIKDPKRMLGYPVKNAEGEAGYLVARYSYMGEIYIYSVDGLLITTLGADTRIAPFWPYPEEKKDMEITGLSFEAEHFWPFMFGLDDGKVYLAVGKWHTSIVRLDGLDKVKRIHLNNIQVTPAMLEATAPVRTQKVMSDELREEVTVSPVQSQIDGNLREWPAGKWAKINADCSFQLGIDGNKLVVAYQTNQDRLLRNSATEYPLAFTQGGGLDLMWRTSGATETRGAMPGDIRLFVTKKNDEVLAVLYRQKTSDGKGSRYVFASPVGQVVFDDVRDVSSYVEVSENGANYEFSIPLSVLGLEDAIGKVYRGDAGIVLSDGVRARARIYWHNKEDSMCSDIPNEARFNPKEWGLFKFIITK